MHQRHIVNTCTVSSVVCRGICILVALFLFSSQLVSPANATLPYSKDTGKKCYYCHANQIGEKSVLTEQGIYWLAHDKSFVGMPEELVPGPPAPEKVKNTPFIAMVLGPLVFFGLIAMLIVGIIKKPALVAISSQEKSKRESDNRKRQ